METSPFPRRAAKFIKPMLGAEGLCRAGRDLYRATNAVTEDSGFSGFIRRTAPLVASYDTQGDAENFFNTDSCGCKTI
jgi:hypothetical protein